MKEEISKSIHRNSFYDNLVLPLLLLSVLTINGQDNSYQADWDSLKKHETPEWFLDAKFGIYCHWGPYSVPAFENEWYAHWMYTNENNPEYEQGKKFYEHHINIYGPLDEFGYKDFIPMFTADKFDAAEWADLFQKAGAKFAGPVSEHADGFAMWDSKLTKWDAKDMGPKLDIMAELSREIRKRDMKFIATFHRHWLLGWYPTWDETTDASNPEYAGLYGLKMKKGDFKYPPDTHEIDARIDPPAEEAYHLYGAWWVDAKTIHYYLDGEFVYTINPTTFLRDEPFNRPMFMHLVTETYNWETPPTPEELVDDSKNTT